MAVIRNTASGLRRGKVGADTYYVSGARQIVRVSQNASNYGETASRTTAQQANRGQWGNLVNFYKASRSWMKYAYESKAKRQSDYNRFMQINKPLTNLYLTKEAIASGACVVGPWKVSEGSLRTITINKRANVWRTSIALGTLDIDETTTVAEFSAACIENNNFLNEGVQISFISYQQEVDGFGFPMCYCSAYEVTLDTKSSAILRDFLPEFCACSSFGYLATNDEISIGAFTYMLSDSTSGVTLTSSQQLVTNNTALIGQYSSEEAKKASIESYKVNEDAFLMSGSKEQNARTNYQYIVNLIANNQTYNTSSQQPDGGAISSLGGTINMATEMTSDAIVQYRVKGSDNWVAATTGKVTTSGKEITLAVGWINTSFYDSKIAAVKVTADGTDYELTFWEAGSIEE